MTQRPVPGRMYYIQPAGGVSSGRKFLSRTQDGSLVDIYNKDDGSGRQRWYLHDDYSERYNINALGDGIGGVANYLSCSPEGKVDIYHRNDNSHRQRWRFEPLPNGCFNIKVCGGTNQGEEYLSCTPDGTLVDLYHCDDNSGRQQWRVIECNELAQTNLVELTISLELKCDSSGGESDGVGEFYGDFWCRFEGQSSWSKIVGTNTSDPWRMLSPDRDSIYMSGWASSQYESVLHTLQDKFVVVPTSASFIEVKASLLEYDPTVFDADENLGTQTIKIALDKALDKEYVGMSQQGNQSIGQVTWTIKFVGPDYKASSPHPGYYPLLF